MTRKPQSAIVLLPVLLAGMLILSACDSRTRYPQQCEHEWLPATCTEREKCKACGTINPDSETLEHEWLPVTCTKYSYCELCLKIDWDSKIPHTYSSTDGTCTMCGGGVKFIVPATPKTISYSSKSKCKIESITIERTGSHAYQLTFIVESTYHREGSAYSEEAHFDWKLYDDAEGLVVDSDRESTDAAIAVGEKSQVVLTFYIRDNSSDLQDGKTYRLELLDID